MPRPTRMQVFWAKGRPWQLWFLLAPVAYSVLYLKRYEVTIDLLGHWPAAFWVVLSAALGWIAGLLIALVVGWMLVGSVQHGRVIANGGPFKVGDLVQVITGPHAGRVGRVYEESRYDTVKVDLGPEARNQHDDSFSGIELLRVKEHAAA